MIRVWMLTWPVTEQERSQQDEEKKSIYFDLKAKRSKSFHTLKAYFSNLGSAFKHPQKSSENEADNMIETQVGEELEELEAEPVEVKREVPVTNVNVHKMIEDLQSEKAETVLTVESPPPQIDPVQGEDVVEEEPTPNVEPIAEIHLEEKETTKAEPVQEVEEEEEPAKIEEEDVETISVFDMVKGFEHIKRDPSVKKVPKEFRKRTTVTLTKQ
ncbi:GATA type zinc finger protein asd-4-like isoform X1 [Haliotis rufescens]|uniref:GATA type zinc finger protein asd-4-like isoform X1 n=1 Tax=Haliotis rufescens TaxID=6454 RepID=UPI00201F9AB6|nr:GATA type zinc finger protein asd-4-like isoform X1 [Haliotis rufescens]